MEAYWFWVIMLLVLLAILAWPIWPYTRDRWPYRYGNWHGYLPAFTAIALIFLIFLLFWFGMIVIWWPWVAYP